MKIRAILPFVQWLILLSVFLLNSKLVDKNGQLLNTIIGTRTQCKTLIEVSHLYSMVIDPKQQIDK